MLSLVYDIKIMAYVTDNAEVDEAYFPVSIFFISPKCNRSPITRDIKIREIM